jgi:hypothetical protein
MTGDTTLAVVMERIALAWLLMVYRLELIPLRTKGRLGLEVALANEELKDTGEAK